MIYGLEKDGESILADVFARKLSALVKGLQAADKAANGKIRYAVVLENLEKHSALVKVSEAPRTKRRGRPGSALLGQAFSAIYNASHDVRNIPAPVMKCVSALTDGVGTSFSHAEAFYSDNNVIRIDDFFAKRLDKATKEIKDEIASESGYNFSGISTESFDGFLKLIDSRGELVRAILKLTSGAREVECLIRQNTLKDVLDKFDKRAIIRGKAFYSAKDLLPQRIEVDTISLTKAGASLLDWKGKFNIPKNYQAAAWLEA